MLNNKKILRFIVTLTCLMLLTGCVDMQSNSDIKKPEDKKEEKVETVYRVVKFTQEEKEYTESSFTREYVYDEEGHCIAEFFNSDGEITQSWKEEYDNFGNVISVEAYDAEGNLASSVKYDYDKNGNCVSTIRYDATGKMTDREECIFDAYNNLVESRRYNENNEDAGFYTYEYKYDKDGNMINKKSYFGQSITDIREYKYDKDGNCITRIDYDAEGVQKTRMEYEYDKNGNCISSIEYNAEGIMKTKAESIYDKKGNLIRHKSSVEEVENTYDKNNNLTVQKVYYKGKLNKIKTFEYAKVLKRYDNQEMYR